MEEKQPEEKSSERVACEVPPKVVGVFSRWPAEPAWRREGGEPDYRFSLANERTFLAWIRTALAALAAGMLLDQMATRVEPRFLVVMVALALCVLAAGLGMVAYRKWRDNEQAMRHSKALPHSRVLSILSVGILAVSVSLAVLVLWNLVTQ